MQPSPNPLVRSRQQSHRNHKRWIFLYPLMIVTVALVTAMLVASIGGPIAEAVTLSFADSVSFGSGSGPLSIAVGDLNGDGKPDLAVANSGSNNVSVLLNTT